jgi:hypothetical protein
LKPVTGSSPPNQPAMQMRPCRRGMAIESRSVLLPLLLAEARRKFASDAVSSQETLAAHRRAVTGARQKSVRSFAPAPTKSAGMESVGARLENKRLSMTVGDFHASWCANGA